MYEPPPRSCAVCESSCLLLCCQCVDLSCNELSEITLPENLPPKLQELDLTGNPRLSLDHKTLEQLKYAIIYLKFLLVLLKYRSEHMTSIFQYTFLCFRSLC